MRILIISLFVCLGLISCQQEEFSNGNFEQDLGEFPGVEQALWPYFEQFEIEANKRGITVDLRSHKILGEIAAIHDHSVAGTCSYDPDNPNQVTIDRDFWNASSLVDREIVVFHELGHCELLRDHREEEDAQGNCLSIMAGGLGNCNLSYNSSTREEFLDELFDEEFAGDWFN